MINLPSLDLHHIMEAVIVAGVLGGFKFLWGVKGTFNTLAASVKNIEMNHLPHLEEKIDVVGEGLQNLNDKFVDHLLREAEANDRERKH